MKLKHIIFTAIAATVIALPLIHADTPDMTATTASATTNATDAMTSLFGDPLIAQGTGVAVKQSDLDQVLTGVKSEAAARGEEISPEQMTMLQAQMLERLIDIQLLLQQANDA